MKAIPGKRFAEIDEGRLEYATAGQGQPVVVFINGGGPANMDSWRKVYPQVEKTTTVFAYNRFGDGNSDRVDEPQTGARIVTALRRLLLAAGLSAPYILVGHSIGGLYANLFPRLYPEEVAGVVLVDSSHPDQGDMMREQPGLMGLINRLFFKAYARSNPSKSSEITAFDDTATQINRAGPFPDVPLTVITAGKRPTLLMPVEILDAVAAHQKDLAQLSPRGKQVFAEKSGHYIQNTQPDVVVDAIRDIIEKARKRESRAVVTTENMNDSDPGGGW